jgi:hypothetical protein
VTKWETVHGIAICRARRQKANTAGRILHERRHETCKPVPSDQYWRAYHECGGVPLAFKKRLGGIRGVGIRRSEHIAVARGPHVQRR